MVKSLKILIPMASIAWIIAFSALADMVFAAEFRILYPKSNDTVRGEIVELEGKGAVVGAKIVVSVLTDRWYIQDGNAEINVDGSWAYAPCYLSGKGRYNNHSVKVKLIKNGKEIATARVRNIVRED